MTKEEITKMRMGRKRFEAFCEVYGFKLTPIRYKRYKTGYFDQYGISITRIFSSVEEMDRFADHIRRMRVDRSAVYSNEDIKKIMGLSGRNAVCKFCKKHNIRRIKLGFYDKEQVDKLFAELEGNRKVT